MNVIGLCPLLTYYHRRLKHISAERSCPTCVIMHSRVTDHAIACLYADALDIYIVFDPYPSIRLPNISQSGATFFCYRQSGGAFDCIQSSFLGVPVNEVSPHARAYLEAHQTDCVDSYVFSPR